MRSWTRPLLLAGGGFFEAFIREPDAVRCLFEVLEASVPVAA